MALALADSIAKAGWDLNDQADRYVEWWKTGKYSINGRCFDIGITTRNALGNYVAKKDALTFGDRSDRASGNSSIMRLAPVPMRFCHLYSSQLDELRACVMSLTNVEGMENVPVILSRRQLAAQ